MTDQNTTVDPSLEVAELKNQLAERENLLRDAAEHIESLQSQLGASPESEKPAPVAHDWPAHRQSLLRGQRTFKRGVAPAKSAPAKPAFQPNAFASVKRG